MLLLAAAVVGGSTVTVAVKVGGVRVPVRYDN